MLLAKYVIGAINVSKYIVRDCIQHNRMYDNLQNLFLCWLNSGGGYGFGCMYGIGVRDRSCHALGTQANTPLFAVEKKERHPPPQATCVRGKSTADSEGGSRICKERILISTTRTPAQ